MIKKIETKFQTLKKALNSLEAVVAQEPDKERMIIDATIQRFEFTFELSWKFLKSYFADKDVFLEFPREILQKAFSTGIINDEVAWLKMLEDRNMTSHTYSEKTADEIYSRIKTYVPIFKDLIKKIENK